MAFAAGIVAPLGMCLEFFFRSSLFPRLQNLRCVCGVRQNETQNLTIFVQSHDRSREKKPQFSRGPLATSQQHQFVLPRSKQDILTTYSGITYAADCTSVLIHAAVRNCSIYVSPSFFIINSRSKQIYLKVTLNLLLSLSEWISIISNLLVRPFFPT